MKLTDVLKNKDKPEDNIRYHLHKYLAQEVPERSHKIVHASDVTKEGSDAFCPREYALLDITKKKRPPQFLSTSLQVTFQLGRDLQDRVVEWLDADGKAITDWKCLNCTQVHQFCGKPKACSNCKSSAFIPQEHRFTSAVSGVSCGIDTLWNSGKGFKNQIVEIKTIKDDDFKKLVAPLAEHKTRTNLYMRLVDESTNPYKNRVNVQEARILYITKGAFGKKVTDLKAWGLSDAPFSPFKEYKVTRDDSILVEELYRAERLKQYRDGDKGVPLGICPNSLCKRAMKCSMLKECFSGKYKGEV